MITSIKIQNFRAFQAEIRVRIRPLTVLIGRNSAGKSSVIKFLLMLKQTLESQGDSFFVTEGNDVQLGTWRDLRHANTRHASTLDKYLRFEIEIVTEDLPSPEVQEMWKLVSRVGAVSTEGNTIKVHLEFPRQPVQRENPQGRFLVQGRVLYGTKFKTGRHEVRGFVNNKEIFRKATDNLETSGFLRFSKRTDSVNRLVEAMAGEPFLESLRQQFVSLRHLSPVREQSQEAVQTGSPPPGYVGHNGEYAMPHLVRLLANPAKEERAKLISQFASQVARVENISVRTEVARLLTDLRGKNMDTGAVCQLADFGFGVSQCLPIFVQGSMHSPHQLLIVEQPEAQLHPTAQLELGSYFADLWLTQKVPSLIETHSANVLLRLRRLVKQRVLSPKDISVAYFTVEEVKPKGGRKFQATVVKNLDINEDGSLTKGLPMEFFGADVLEALEMSNPHGRK
jgi:predicted ATPase